MKAGRPNDVVESDGDLDASLDLTRGWWRTEYEICWTSWCVCVYG